MVILSVYLQTVYTAPRDYLILASIDGSAIGQLHILLFFVVICYACISCELLS